MTDFPRLLFVLIWSCSFFVFVFCQFNFKRSEIDKRAVADATFLKPEENTVQLESSNFSLEISPTNKDTILNSTTERWIEKCDAVSLTSRAKLSKRSSNFHRRKSRREKSKRKKSRGGKTTEEKRGKKHHRKHRKKLSRKEIRRRKIKKYKKRFWGTVTKFMGDVIKTGIDIAKNAGKKVLDVIKLPSIILESAKILKMIFENSKEILLDEKTRKAILDEVLDAINPLSMLRDLKDLLTGKIDIVGVLKNGKKRSIDYNLTTKWNSEVRKKWSKIQKIPPIVRRPPKFRPRRKSATAQIAHLENITASNDLSGTSLLHSPIQQKPFIIKKPRSITTWNSGVRKKWPKIQKTPPIVRRPPKFPPRRNPSTSQIAYSGNSLLHSPIQQKPFIIKKPRSITTWNSGVRKKWPKLQTTPPIVRKPPKFPPRKKLATAQIAHSKKTTASDDPWNNSTLHSPIQQKPFIVKKPRSIGKWFSGEEKKWPKIEEIPGKIHSHIKSAIKKIAQFGNIFSLGDYYDDDSSLSTPVQQKEYTSRKPESNTSSLQTPPSELNKLKFRQYENTTYPDKESNIDFLFVIISPHENYEARAASRITWKNYIDANSRTKLIYLVDAPTTPSNKLNIELKYFNDMILTESSQDRYDNSQMVKSMLQWIVAHCPEVKFVVRVDDHVFINVPKLLSLVQTFNENDAIIMGTKQQFSSDIGNIDTRNITDCLFPQPHPLKEFSNTLYILSREVIKHIRCFSSSDEHMRLNNVKSDAGKIHIEKKYVPNLITDYYNLSTTKFKDFVGIHTSKQNVFRENSLIWRQFLDPLPS